MPEPLRFVEGAGGYELRRGAALAGRAGPATGTSARVEAGDRAWELRIEGDRNALAATWQVVARETDADEPAAVYFRGSIRGGRVRAGDRTGSLRRELGVSSEWRLRFPDAALAIRPPSEPGEAGLDLEFVPGSAAVPDLFVVFICWCVMSEETVGPARHAG